jgi:hypothetical protein
LTRKLVAMADSDTLVRIEITLAIRMIASARPIPA